jgi:hypothetical protein
MLPALLICAALISIKSTYYAFAASDSSPDEHTSRLLLKISEHAISGRIPVWEKDTVGGSIQKVLSTVTRTIDGLGFDFPKRIFQPSGFILKKVY